MKRPDTPDQVTRENRKNWPRFILILLASAVGGAVLGYSAAWLAGNAALGALADTVGRAAGACAPFAVLAAALFLIPAAICLRRGQALCARWDGEDEDAPEQVEGLLNWSLLWLTAAQLGGFVLFGIIASLEPLGYADPLALLPAVGEMLLLTLTIIALQRRVVDLTRRLNPEKQGSVYDFRFRKKWLASCDEAERQRIGQASYTSYTVTHYSCLFVWVVLVVLNILVPIGPLPIIAVFIPWALGQFTYLGQCIRMETPKRSR